MLAIGCDHGGFELKNHIIGYLKEKGFEIKDFGTYDENSVDYPDIAEVVCRSITSGECERGILVCGTGIGMSIAANKVKGIRAAMCTDVYSAKMTKQHNNTNVLCLGGRVTGRELAFMICETWLGEEFLGGRHQNRIDKISNLEK
ncbi:MAG: ribose 5-phosphate isomerase B [Ruminococcaceae bacterium]|nr:ribose 5-phosphate isomerase B [Oscillospiraceae bacterium]